MFSQENPQKKHIPKSHEQTQYPGKRVQINVKVVPRNCIADPEFRLFEHMAIDEFLPLRFLGFYKEQSTYLSAELIQKAITFYEPRCITVECVQTDNGFETTNRFSNSKRHIQTPFKKTTPQLGHTNVFVHIPRYNGKVAYDHR